MYIDIKKPIEAKTFGWTPEEVKTILEMKAIGYIEGQITAGEVKAADMAEVIGNVFGFNSDAASTDLYMSKKLISVAAAILEEETKEMVDSGPGEKMFYLMTCSLQGFSQWIDWHFTVKKPHFVANGLQLCDFHNGVLDDGELDALYVPEEKVENLFKGLVLFYNEHVAPAHNSLMTKTASTGPFRHATVKDAPVALPFASEYR